MIFNQYFKDIVIFSYIDIYQVVKDKENRNITNTYKPLLDFIEGFEVEIKDNKLYMYCEDEYEIRMCDIVFYDVKHKSFQIQDDTIYYELLNIVRTFKKLNED